MVLRTSVVAVTSKQAGCCTRSSIRVRSGHRDSHLKLTTSKLLQLELWLWLLWFAISEPRMGLIHA